MEQRHTKDQRGIMMIPLALAILLFGLAASPTEDATLAESIVSGLLILSFLLLGFKPMRRPAVHKALPSTPTMAVVEIRPEFAVDTARRSQTLAVSIAKAA